MERLLAEKNVRTEFYLSDRFASKDKEFVKETFKNLLFISLQIKDIEKYLLTTKKHESYFENRWIERSLSKLELLSVSASSDCEENCNGYESETIYTCICIVDVEDEDLGSYSRVLADHKQYAERRKLALMQELESLND
jgi:hypothetical protein